MVTSSAWVDSRQSGIYSLAEQRVRLEECRGSDQPFAAVVERAFPKAVARQLSLFHHPLQHAKGLGTELAHPILVVIHGEACAELLQTKNSLTRYVARQAPPRTLGAPSGSHLHSKKCKTTSMAFAFRCWKAFSPSSMLLLLDSAAASNPSSSMFIQ